MIVCEKEILNFNDSLNNKFLNIELNSKIDENYKSLIYQLNQAYKCEFYGLIEIILKKIINNLIIDIFRLFYIKDERLITYFFDLEKTAYLDFQILLKNFKTKLHEFSSSHESLLQELDVLESISKNWNGFKENYENDSVKLQIIKNRLIENRNHFEMLIRLLFDLYISLLNKIEKTKF